MLKAMVIPLIVLGTLAGRADFAADEKPASVYGVVGDTAGKRLAGAVVELWPANMAGPLRSPAQSFPSRTDDNGAFVFEQLPPGTYSVSLTWQGRSVSLQSPVELREGQHLKAWLEFSPDPQRLALHLTQESSTATEVAVTSNAQQGSNEAQLSSKQVSDLPLNKRDFTQLLQQAAGTTTDTNGAANFTQQFAINGQRGTTAVLAMDGVDTTDPELGGATFANFNVDAIQEVRSDSGVLPATVGEGAAGFTDVITKSGTKLLHGSVFEFTRNAAFDARNFFDRRSVANPGRIPPFVRNEFGFTNGGPVVLPKIYDGRGRTFYFGQYQGFRQVLSVTEVLPVPTAAEREGVDTTTFPGDTLTVPVDQAIARVLGRYPLPNDLEGAYGARTFATPSKVSTNSDQFSIRVDHALSDKAQFFGRFNFDNINGPTTNPSQIAIDPSFAIRFYDHQRNVALRYARSVSPNLLSESALGYIRSTPVFTTVNQVQPGLTFADELYEPFNSASGENYGSWGNLWQARQSFNGVRGAHSFKMGFEARLNRDTTIFALGPNGTYTFGGGTAYSPVTIRSASGLHDLHAGDPLPDSLTGFLTGTPYSFTSSLAGPEFPQGNRIGLVGVQREAYNAYFQDNWKVSPHLSLNYGLRYEVNTRIHEKHHLTSAPLILGPEGKQVVSWASGAYQDLLVYPQPPYRMDWRGWGPRVALDWRATQHTTLRAGAGITTLLPNLFIDNGLTGGIPYVLNPYFTARPEASVPFTGSVLTFKAPPIYTPQGALIFAGGNTTRVPANTPVDLQRLEDDLAALSPGQSVQALLVFGMVSRFQNGYIETYTAGAHHEFGDVILDASYVGTAGVKLPGLVFPNNYPGADPAFAPFTRFHPMGQVLGGIGPEFLMGNPSHSTFHSAEMSVSKTSLRWGLGFQTSYTFSKSIDNASTATPGLGLAASGTTVLQPAPQDPRHPGMEKGPSTFDITHILTFNFVQALPFDRVAFLRPLGHRLTSGWQLLNVSVLTSGPPFSILSGVQQTGLGSDGADRPDQVSQPVLSTGRSVREDYFGRGANNASFFSIPLDVPGGTGPNHGRLGTLGRNTFRGPGYHNFDLSLMKDTALFSRGNSEPVTLQFRAEFFNAFNLVNFGLPSNIVRGSGFGVISRTAGTSRQLQFSLKLVF